MSVKCWKLFVMPLVLVLTMAALLCFSTPVYAQAEQPADETPAIEVTTAETTPEEISTGEETQAAEEAPVESTETTPAEESSQETGETAPTEEAPLDTGETAPTEETPLNTGEVIPTEEAPLDTGETAPTEETPLDTGETALTEEGGKFLLPGEENFLLYPTTEDSVSETVGELAELGVSLENASGESIPLTSNEAVDALTSPAPDPWFMVGATRYEFLAAGCALEKLGITCFESATPIQAAIDYIRDNPTRLPTDGTIHVDAGAFAETVSIDGAANPILAKLKGLIGAGSDTVTLTGNIIIDTLTSGFTLKGFNILANSAYAVAISNVTGALKLEDLIIDSIAGGGLSVTLQKGAVTLNGVSASTTNGTGALLDNSSSIAAVTINNSAFDENAGDGLNITSNGLVTLTGVSASRNTGGYGANILLADGLTVKKSTFDGNDGFGLAYLPHASGGNLTLDNVQTNENGQDGISATVYGNATLKNVRSVNNARSGIDLDTCDWDIPNNKCKNKIAGNVSLTSITVTDNAGTVDGDGINVVAKGSITLNDVYSGANGNGAIVSNGATLDNTHGSGTVSITNSSFNSNNGTGLNVTAKGAITLTNSSASNNVNNGYGALLNNTLGVYNVSVNAGLNQGNNFNDNANIGLAIVSKGSVIVQGATAQNNNDNGIDIDNSGGSGAVTLDGKTGTDINYNATGINIISKGTVTVKNMNAWGNSENGMYINNLLGSGGVNIQSSLTYWSNYIGDNGQNGLEIVSKGAVLIDKTIAMLNAQFGASIDNSAGRASVTITNSNFNDNGEVTGYGGLYVLSGGNIVLTTAEVNHNGNNDDQDGANVDGYGAVLNNSGSALTTPPIVKITGASFNDNYGNGLTVQSKGAVTLLKSPARNNTNTGSYGAFINNTSGAVTISGAADSSSDFNNNASFGLYVTSNGAITVKYIHAENNGSYGLFLDNHTAAGAQPVTIQYSRFENNTSYGVQVDSKGNVTLTLTNSESNGGYGLDIDNSSGTGNVTISGAATDHSNFNSNSTYGVNVLSNGAITIKYSSAHQNSSEYGMKLDNSIAPAARAVLIQYTHISQNATYGLEVLSKGNVTITSIQSQQNIGGFGLNINNSSGTGSVTISGAESNFNQLWGNSGYGMNILSNGAITIKYINANGNGAYGANLDNSGSAAATPPAVTIYRGWFNDNTAAGGYGLQVKSRGNITVTRIDAGNNNTFGATLNNTGVSNNGTGSVSISGLSNTLSWLGNNGTDGLSILSNSTVTVRYIEANWNTSDGILINNATAAAARAVTLSDVNASDNANSAAPGYGLQVNSKGNILLTRVFANNNGDSDNTYVGYGFSLDNCQEVGGVCTGSGAVTLNRTETSDNYGYGTDIKSKGAVTLTNASSTRNTTYGMLVNNILGIANVTINGGLKDSKGNYITNKTNYSDNGDFGLDVLTNGVILVDYVRVGNNGAYGAKLDNDAATTAKNVTVTNSEFFDNHAGIGLDISSAGSIALTSVSAFNNNAQGALLHNENAIVTPKVTPGITVKNSYFGNNGNAGLDIYSRGNVLLTDVDAMFNGDEGVAVDNTGVGNNGTGTVTVNGRDNDFLGNTGVGLLVVSNRNFSLTNFTAEYNGTQGVLFESSLVGTGTANISNGIASNNGHSGIEIDANNTVTMKNITAMKNGTAIDVAGVVITSHDHNIDISDSSFALNSGSGIDSNTGAAFTLKLTRCTWMGNDTDNSGDANIQKTGFIIYA